MDVFLIIRWRSGTVWPLAGALALLLCRRFEHLAPAVPVGAHGAVGDPRPVHAPLHTLHDQIQQDLHSLGHVLTVRRARLEVRDPERVSKKEVL